MDGGMQGATLGNDEVMKAEMISAALRGQSHAGGAAVAATQQAGAAGLDVTDTVEISAGGQALAAAAAADTE